MFSRASAALVAWWNLDRTPRNNSVIGLGRNFEGELAVAHLLARYVLGMSPQSTRTVLEPILGEVDSHPRELATFVRDLAVAEEREPNTAQFWYIWGLLAERIKKAH